MWAQRSLRSHLASTSSLAVSRSLLDVLQELKINFELKSTLTAELIGLCDDNKSEYVDNGA